VALEMIGPAVQPQDFEDFCEAVPILRGHAATHGQLFVGHDLHDLLAENADTAFPSIGRRVHKSLI
jgi:hypothetical protein